MPVKDRKSNFSLYYKKLKNTDYLKAQVKLLYNWSLQFSDAVQTNKLAGVVNDTKILFFHAKNANKEETLQIVADGKHANCSSAP